MIDPTGCPVVPLSTRVRRRGDVLTVTGSAAALELSATAALIFLALDGTRSVTEVAARIAAQFDVPTEVVLDDAGPVLADLLAAGAIRLPAPGEDPRAWTNP